jgi:hypothetical protein
MTGVGKASKQGYLGFRKLVNAADEFPMRIQRNIQRWGGEEKPVALRLQTRCLEVAKSHGPKHVTMQRSFTTSKSWHRRFNSIIIVNDPCPFLVLLIQQSLMCFLCAVHLEMGRTLPIKADIAMATSRLSYSSVRNGVRWGQRDCTGK